jgi:undecaprenyl-diphosphatase
VPTYRRSLPALVAHAVPLALAWVGLLVVLVAVGEVTVHSAAITHFDHHVTTVVVAHRSPALNRVMKALTWMGSWVSLVLTGAVLVVLLVLRRLPTIVVALAIVAWLGELVGVHIAKVVLRRPRPPEALWLVKAHGWSFPSGHAATATLVFIVLALVVTTLARHRMVRVLTWLAACLAVAVVAFSRVELGVHWTTDVLASIVFVAGWLSVIVALFATSLSPSRTPRGLAVKMSQREFRGPIGGDTVRDYRPPEVNRLRSYEFVD